MKQVLIFITFAIVARVVIIGYFAQSIDSTTISALDVGIASAVATTIPKLAAYIDKDLKERVNRRK